MKTLFPWLNKQWAEDNRWLITLAAVTALAELAWAISWLLAPKDPPIPFRPVSKMVLLGFACVVGWFLDIFTGDATRRKVDQMVAFCYVFPFVMFAAILVPLFAYPVALPDPPKPVGVILGCNLPPANADDRHLVPSGIVCGNATDQWLVNIGGDAVQRKETPSAEQLLAQLKAGPPPVAEAAAGVVPVGFERPAGAAPAAAAPEPEQTPKFVITGGLVVPLYFVILAIFGGFVSMLRRVPEYQERVSPCATDPLSLERARERLVFEVLQLLAAPLIAITAYYLIDPASRASSLALAFIAGFSSETVLLYVRALSEKLQPQTWRAESEVSVVPAALEFDPQPLGSVSPPQSITLGNRSSSTLQGTVRVVGDFRCPQDGEFQLEPGGSKTFVVSFLPAAIGARTGQLQIRDNGPGSPRMLPLTGTGIPPPTGD